MEQILFAPGDRVVCVDASGNSGLLQGREYTVNGIKRRDCCGRIVVDVGIRQNTSSQRCACGFRMTPSDHYKKQTRFVPVDFDRYAEETFHQSLKGKPVNA